MNKTYHVTAWRQENRYATDTFEADTPEQALLQAKTAFEDEFGESCGSGERWNEFVVTLDDEQVLAEYPPDHLATLLNHAERNARLMLHAADLLRELGYEDVALDLFASSQATREAIAEATGRPA
jgi:hypothetical protein